MIRKLFYYIFLWILLGIPVGMSAQVVITPTQLQGPFFRFEQLAKVKIINVSSEPIRGYLEVQVEDGQQTPIITMRSIPIEIQAASALNQTNIQWERGLELEASFSRILSQGNQMPVGNYIYCYRFISIENRQMLGVHCQEKSLMQLGLPRLAYPTNGKEIPNVLPVLSWIPPIPANGIELNYSLRLVSLNEAQAPIDAINANLPLLDRHNLRTLALSYPPTAIGLEEGQQYAWQITAFWNTMEIGKTDIWTFSIQETELNETEEEIRSESFRLVKSYLDGSRYIFSDRIFLGYRNREREAELDYTIYPKGNKSLAIANLPKVKLDPGLNQIEIDLKQFKNMDQEQEYILEIEDRRGGNYFLQFALMSQKAQTQEKIEKHAKDKM